MNIKIICCENILITCFAFYFEMWNVIWKMRFKFVFLQKLFEMSRFLDHAWSFHRQFFFNCLISFFDEWRMLILDYRMTYVYSRFVERHLWWNVKLDEIFHQIWSEAIHQIWNDSSILTKAIHQIDEKDVISSNLTKALFQIWRKQFIKFDEKDVISSNLTKALF
jgi:hypothetical protein